MRPTDSQLLPFNFQSRPCPLPQCDTVQIKQTEGHGVGECTVCCCNHPEQAKASTRWQKKTKQKNPRPSTEVLFWSVLEQSPLVILLWSLRQNPISKLLQTWWDNPDRQKHHDQWPGESHHLSASAKHTAHFGVPKWIVWDCTGRKYILQHCIFKILFYMLLWLRIKICIPYGFWMGTFFKCITTYKKKKEYQILNNET